jgi:magnesium transporter
MKRQNLAGFLKQQSKKAGLPPGTLMHIGDQKRQDVRLTLIVYNEAHFEVSEPKAVDCPRPGPGAVYWLNVSGISQLDAIEEIGKRFQLHPLLLEDVVNTNQRPKLDDYKDYLYIVLKMLYRQAKDKATTVEQVSLVLGQQYVISFQENGADPFNAVRERLRTGKGRLRTMGPDYLVYALMDSIVDQYFGILETLGERIESLEEQVVSHPQPEVLKQIHATRRELLFLRRAVWPLREVTNGLQREESPLIKETTRIYLRDVYDHAVQVIDTIEIFREMVSSMLDVYLSSISYRLNTVMKVLTIITTIFMPLTFIAGVYGMNFKHMPELDWYWGYPAVLLVMTVIAGAMLGFFRKKKWL